MIKNRTLKLFCLFSLMLMFSCNDLKKISNQMETIKGNQDIIIAKQKDVDNKLAVLNNIIAGLNVASNKSATLNTNLNGSIRPIISMGNWENVLPINILPEFLVKSILAKDIDMMEKLGIYECAPEDFSLCSFVCQSKVEVSSIIENGLKIMEEEA